MAIHCDCTIQFPYSGPSGNDKKFHGITTVGASVHFRVYCVGPTCNATSDIRASAPRQELTTGIQSSGQRTADTQVLIASHARS